MNPVISVKGLGKRYQLGETHKGHDTLRDAIVAAVKSPFSILNGGRGEKEPLGPDHIWALKDVNMEVEQGEVVGIIGKNGAGKSTLLKILSEITEPTEGEVVLRGRVSSLLEVGTGFHPELTGRENVFMNGAILGMTRAEIKSKFDEIVAFSEVEDFIDTHLEPEILLVDEVLAVGDAGFQKKCLGKMGDVTEQGRTVLFVSHNMASISSLCQRCILLNNGRVAESGDPQDVIIAYLQALEAQSGESLLDVDSRSGSGRARLTSIRLRDSQGEKFQALQSGRTLLIELDYESDKELLSPCFYIGINDFYGQRIFFLDSSVMAELPVKIPAKGSVTCRIDNVPLTKGSYRLNLALLSSGEICDHIVNASELSIVEGDFYGSGRTEKGRSVCHLMHSWQFADMEK